MTRTPRPTIRRYITPPASPGARFPHTSRFFRGAVTAAAFSGPAASSAGAHDLGDHVEPDRPDRARDHRPAAANNGKRLPLSPKLSGSVWSTYRLPKGWTLGGGVRGTSEVFINAANTIVAPGYGLVDGQPSRSTSAATTTTAAATTRAIPGRRS